MSNATGRFSTRWRKEGPARGPDIKLTEHGNTPLSAATRSADIENLSKVQNSRPLKPPKRRAQ